MAMLAGSWWRVHGLMCEDEGKNKVRGWELYSSYNQLYKHTLPSQRKGNENEGRFQSSTVYEGTLTTIKGTVRPDWI